MIFFSSLFVYIGFYFFTRPPRAGGFSLSLPAEVKLNRALIYVSANVILNLI